MTCLQSMLKNRMKFLVTDRYCAPACSSRPFRRLGFPALRPRGPVRLEIRGCCTVSAFLRTSVAALLFQIVIEKLPHLLLVFIPRCSNSPAMAANRNRPELLRLLRSAEQSPAVLGGGHFVAPSGNDEDGRRGYFSFYRLRGDVLYPCLEIELIGENR